LEDADLVDAIEGLLHRLAITTGTGLAAHQPWHLSRRLVALAPTGLKADPVLTPSAVEVWAQ